MKASAIRVVLVAESPGHRSNLRQWLQAEGDIVVVAEASTFAGAAAAVARGVPDVVAIASSELGGEEEAVARIMQRLPRPILVVTGPSAGPRSGSSRKAILAGAAGVISRPAADADGGALRRRVRSLHHGRASVLRPAPGPRPLAPRLPARPTHPDAAGRPVAPASPVLPVAPATPLVSLPSRRARLAAAMPTIVAIGASTGGPSAVEAVLGPLHGAPVAVALVQHIDGRLVDGFASWLEKVSGWPVAVATEGSAPEVGVVTVGPGGRHLELDARGRFTLRDTPRSLHMPSADRLFASLAEHAPSRVVAALLTGMGSDGAEGLLALRQAGATTFAQDEASSAVFGMSRAAYQLGAVDVLTPLDVIGPTIAERVGSAAGRARS